MRKLTKITTKKLISTLGLLFYLFTCNLAFAGNMLDFRILQETICKDGIMIARPKPEDEKIYNLLLDNKIHNPKEYAQWLSDNIQYKRDRKGDRWTRPLDVLRKKYGDCEDFTMLNIVVLRVMGYKPIFIAFFNKAEGHAVCVFKHGGRYYYFDNMELKPIKESSLLEFSKNISTAKKYSEIKELDLETRKWNLIYKNT